MDYESPEETVILLTKRIALIPFELSQINKKSEFKPLKTGTDFKETQILILIGKSWKTQRHNFPKF